MVARVSLLLVVTPLSLAIAQQNTSQTSPVPPEIRAKHDRIAAAKVIPTKDFEQIAPYWTAESGWHTELQLRNNLAAESLVVMPSLRTADGTETTLNPVTLLPGEVQSVNLNEALAAVNSSLAGQANAYGSIVMRYNSKASRNLYASVMVHDTGYPIMYHIDAMIQAPGYVTGSREGIWWLPTKSTRDYLVLTNQSDHPLQGTLWLYDAAGRSWNQPLKLGTKQMQRLSVRQLVTSAGFWGQYGGIKVEMPQGAGSLDTVHIVYDELAGFSATLKMFDYDPRTKLEARDYAGKGRWTTRAPMLALTNPDPILALPAKTVLQPMLLIRNTTAKSVKVDLSLHWRNASADGRGTLPELTLAPFEIRKVDIQEVQNKGTIPLDAYWAQVTMMTDTLPDEVMAVAASYDATLRYGAQTPFSDQLIAHLEGGQWQVDANHTSLIAAGNGGDKPAKAALTFFYDQGRKQYRLEHTIAADDQWWVDIGQLIRSQIPDKNGSTLPAGLTSGAYQLREISEPQQDLLYEGKVITDKTFGHATYGCMVCCGYGGDAGLPFLVEDPTGVDVANTNYVDVYGTNACTGNPDPLDSYFPAWSSLDTSILTASSYSVTGVALGSTSILADATLMPTGQGQDQRQACPKGRAQGKGAGNVQTCPTSISVDQIWSQPLQNDYPTWQTGVGILSRMKVGPVGTDFTSVVLSETVTPTGDSCPSNIQSYTDFPTITYGHNFIVGLSAAWEGNSYPSVYNAFYDQHVDKISVNILGYTNVTSCQATATQVYTCNGQPVGTFTLTNTYTSGFIGGQPVTFVSVSKQ
jgi:hypothetical protein